jgi:DnaB-like helicase N terminal domain/AAA domain
MSDDVPELTGLNDVEWDGSRGTARCQTCGARSLVLRRIGRKVSVSCKAGCKSDGRNGARGEPATGKASKPHETPAVGAPPQSQSPPNGHSSAPPVRNGHVAPTQTLSVVPSRNGHDSLLRAAPQNLEAEQSVLGAILLDNNALQAASEILQPDSFYRESHRHMYRAMLRLDERHEPIDAITLTAELEAAGKLREIGGAGYIAELAALVPAASTIAHYARIVRDKQMLRDLSALMTRVAREAYEPSMMPATHLVAEAQRALMKIASGVPAAAGGGEMLICEDHRVATIANTAYLEHEAIIEALGFTSSIALAVGGKHAGKTTNVRTCALAISRGLPIWQRATVQGAVVYAASDDEVAVSRMELLRMGWNPRQDNLTLVRVAENVRTDTDGVLEQIAKKAIERNAKFIVVDMLFDFAGIRDEMGYAHTREQIGKIQLLATQTGAFVMATHHSPKYMTDAAAAATAALGSQGIAARFSPIILVRKWADDLFTVESTMTRDPRGRALVPTCVEVDQNGWVQATAEFKSWMKHKMYRLRVLPLFEQLPPDKTLTVREIAETLEISRPDTQNCVYHLWKEGILERRKGKRGGEQYLMKRTDDLFSEGSERTPD